MKIGAGGLQAIINQDAAKGIDPAYKAVSEKALLQSEDPNLRKQLYALNKAVERMKKTAEAFNQPLDFEVKRGEKPKIKMKDRRTGSGREFTLEESEEWVKRLESSKGRVLDGYA
jgi:hypothetical protein